MEPNSASLRGLYAYTSAKLYSTVYGEEMKGSQERGHLNTSTAPVEVLDNRGKGGYNGGQQGQWVYGEVEEVEEKRVSTATYNPNDLLKMPNQAPSSMFWTCTTCSKTVSIFFRSQHLTSKDHAKRLRKQPQPQFSEQVIPTWLCTICQGEVNVFYKADHLAGKKHAKVLREKGYPPEFTNSGEPPEPTAVYQPPDEYPIKVEDISSSCDKIPSPPPDKGYTEQFPVNYNSLEKPSEGEGQRQRAATPRPGDVCPPEAPASELDLAEIPPTPESFRSTVCNDKEIPTKNEKYHRPTWECTICKRTMHLGSMESHLRGEKHQKRKAKASPAIAPAEHIAPSLDPTASTSQHQAEETERQAEIPTSMPGPTATDVEKTYCEICKLVVGEKEKKYHRSKAWECTLCNITMHISSKRSHIAGKKHNKKLALQEHAPF